MSLPLTNKEISENPSKNSVTAPTDVATQRAEVDRKMRLYGVVQAFMKGRFPSNAQAEEALAFAQSETPFNVKDLSQEGQVLVEDARDIIATARQMIREKNKDELLQNFLWKGKKADVSAAKVDSKVIPVSQDQVSADASKAAEHLRVLFTLLVTNSEARKLFSDVGLIAQDLFARGAAEVASKAAPNQSKLENVDGTAPDSEWKGANGQTHGTDSTPQLQLNLPGGNTITADPHADPSKADVNGRPAHEVAGEAKDKASSAVNQAQEAKDEASAEAKAHADDVQRRIDAESDPEKKKQIAKEEGNNKLNMAQNKLNDLKNRIPEEHRQKIVEHKDKAINKLKEEFPEERRQQWIHRLKKVLTECQKHSDYQSSMSWLIDTVASYGNHAQTTANNVKSSVGQVKDDSAATGAFDEFRTLLERFANNSSSQPIFDALDDIVRDIKNDDQLKNWFTKLDNYIRKVLLEPGYILQDRSTKEAKDLQKEGEIFFNPKDGKYAGHKDSFINAVADFFGAMGKDPINVKLGEDISRLTTDLFLNSNGDLEFKSHLWQDIRRTIAPAVLEKIGLIPIPPVQYTDDSVDLVIENLILSGQNMLPNVVEFQSHHHVKLSPSSNIADEQEHSVGIKLSQIQADMRDVGFYFKKKTGFPKLTERGLADVIIGGTGLTADILLSGSSNNKNEIFRVKHVKVKIDSPKFNIRDSNHNFLFKAVRVLATGLIKKAVTKAIEKGITTALERVNAELFDIKYKLDIASNSDNISRTDVLKDLFQKKKDEASEKKSQAESVKNERNARFSVIMNPSQVIVHSGAPPTQQVKRLEQLEEQVSTGKGWHSDAFSIISNAQSNPATSATAKL